MIPGCCDIMLVCDIRLLGDTRLVYDTRLVCDTRRCVIPDIFFNIELMYRLIG